MAKRPAQKPKKQAKQPQNAAPEGEEHKGITQEEVKVVEEMSTPRTPVIYEVVRRLGDEEMHRPAVSLWWSGIAAGLSISFSLLAEAIIQAHLPVSQWRPLVVSIGYSVGFLMTVMARQQLFTESTITVVLPVLKDLTWHNLFRMTRLWAIVLIANLIGTLIATLFCFYSPVLPADLLHGMQDISRHLLAYSWWDMLFRAIPAGFLIASMVWMIPASEHAQFFVITLMTWLISVSGSTHIVAGSMEAYLLTFGGDWVWWQPILWFLAPVLIGNIIGGTVLFTVIAYAQVMKEL
ncbi:MAG TPA: formate/nitrite transporter family protein [Pseudolabrys sp.]|nr:formate/nitrite transporter family protein [Pseudolabrys sp.]